MLGGTEIRVPGDAAAEDRRGDGRTETAEPRRERDRQQQRRVRHLLAEQRIERRPQHPRGDRREHRDAVAKQDAGDVDARRRFDDGIDVRLAGFRVVVAERIEDPRDDERDDSRQPQPQPGNRQRNNQVVDADGTKDRPYDDRRARDEKRRTDPGEAARDLRERLSLFQTRFSDEHGPLCSSLATVMWPRQSRCCEGPREQSSARGPAGALSSDALVSVHCIGWAFASVRITGHDGKCCYAERDLASDGADAFTHANARSGECRRSAVPLAGNARHACC